MNPEDLIVDEANLPIDPEGIVEDINVTAIEEQAKEESLDMCKNLRKVYFDERFMNENPLFKKRLDVELESLRVLIKMRKSDEIAHDLCLRSIGMHTNVASLYAALARIQTSMLNIQKQMDETVKNINFLLKNVQLELNFDKPQDDQSAIPVGNDPNITRGSKKFIEQMKKEMEGREISITEDEMFETRENVTQEE